jgi:hypothetical protein
MNYGGAVAAFASGEAGPGANIGVKAVIRARCKISIIAAVSFDL